MSYSAPRLHFFPVCIKYTAITVFGYLNSISVDFYDFISFYFNSLLASTEKRVLNATRSGVVLFQKLVLRVSPGFQTLENNKTWKPGETLALVFEIVLLRYASYLKLSSRCLEMW